MAGMLRVPMRRGDLTGVLLVLLGAWGAHRLHRPVLHYAFTPDRAWSYTTGRLWLEILPGAGALAGGLIVLASWYRRPMALFGTGLAALSGAWFAVGNVPAPTWTGVGVTAGRPVGGTLMRAVEQIGFFHRPGRRDRLRRHAGNGGGSR